MAVQVHGQALSRSLPEQILGHNVYGIRAILQRYLLGERQAWHRKLDEQRLPVNGHGRRIGIILDAPPRR